MRQTPPHTARSAGIVLAVAVCLGGSGCMALSPQLPPTDMQALDRLESRQERETAYTEQAIYVHQEPQGTRYTKGTDPHAKKRSWQSLDVILRSEKHASQALPVRELRLARLFTALTLASVVATVAGTAASAREGLDLKRLNGTGGVLLGGGVATLAFGITAGFMFGKAKKGYVKAVDVYNDALGMRLGVLTPAGEYVPPRGVLVDSEGYVVLDNAEAATGSRPEGPAPAESESAPEAPAPAPEPTPDPEPASPESPAGEADVPPEAPPVQRPTSPPKADSDASVALRPRSG